MKKILATGSVIIAVFLIGCGANSPTKSDRENLDTQVTTTTPQATSTTVVKTPPPVAKVKDITEGDWEIGKKDNLDAGVITPGLYIVTAIADSYGCYWERVRDFDGDVDSIISNGNIDEGKFARVNVKASDKGLHLDSGCLAKKK